MIVGLTFTFTRPEHLSMLCLLPLLSLTLAADPWLVIPGGSGPGNGKTVVLISGDEEYRSEEALPQLAKILSARHGFDTVTLFAIDPATGEINPNKGNNIPGLESLAKADLVIMGLRFRALPPEQMKLIDTYLMSGKPVIGLRTSTHAFNMPKDHPYAHYGNGYGGERKEWVDGFGRLVLGEKWISHHGNHGSQATRGRVIPEQKDNPLLRGIEDGEIFGPSDVYGVRLPLPGDSKALVLGEVVAGMKPSDPAVTTKVNQPMMPIVWTKSYKLPDGKTGQCLTTTMGASQDLENEALRRLIVNASYRLTGLEVPSKADVAIVGTYKPTRFSFNGHTKGIKPSDLK
jgi:hypothetical protein